MASWSFEQEKILIVEDDEVSNLLIMEILREISPDVIRAKTGIEAIDESIR